MNLLVLGRGKTGSLVEEVARARRHHVRVVGGRENQNASALTSRHAARRRRRDRFHDPSKRFMETSKRACSQSKRMVVGTTGWHGELADIRSLR